jgi:ATP-binding cassette subfamily B protein AbcA/BmrA
MEDKEKETGKKCFHTQYKADRSYATIEALQTGMTTIISVLLTVLIFIIGRNKIAQGEMSTGNVLAFYTISAMVIARFSQIILFYNSITETNGTLAKICAVFEYDEEVMDGFPLDIPNRDIQINDVHFGYTDKPVLNGVTCVIPKNKITAIIGANGTGKSTLFKLLERIYEPDEGEICFGEEPVKRFSLKAWRKAFAIVTQDRPLMQGTIRENITYGCERDITETELKEVASKANILDLVSSLPDGFDTQVGPNGSNFSGGQRQCIAIARAIMRNPDYLLLDEATSNLDAKNESMVTSALQNLMIGRTTLIIAHNLSAIRHADNVIVMQDGKVTACGTPQDVIKSSDAYRDFATCQTR